MIVYGLTIGKTDNGNILYQSPQFKGLQGIGADNDSAFVAMIQQVEAELSRIIDAGEAFPKGIDPAKASAKKDTGSFILPLAMQLTMRLHETMLAKKVTRHDLARLLALDDMDVANDGWELHTILKLKPHTAPKYQKVRRLLDIQRDSSINEMAEAFRVLGCDVDVIISDK